MGRQLQSVSELDDLPADTAWLRRVAHGLARGEPDAEDIAQEAWLVALQSEAKGPRRPWLAGVARNKLRMRRRGEGRQRDRETAASAIEPEDAPSADQLLERAELLRLIAQLVMQLDEPIRRALLLRYVDGLSAVQIARLTKEPEGTVRWRLKVGIDRLREQLDERTNGERRQWVLLLVPATPRSSAWSRAETSLAVAVVACGALLLTDPGSSADESDVAPSAADGVANAKHAPPQSGVKVSPTIAPPKAFVDPSVPFGAFEGVVLNDRTVEPIANAELTFMRDDTTTFAAQTDTTGRFEFVPQHAGHYRVTGISAPGHVTAATSWNRSTIELNARPHRRVQGLVLWLPALVEHEGKVVARDGRPVAGAVVRVVGEGDVDPELGSVNASVISDLDGKFKLRASPDCVLEAQHAQFGRGRSSTFQREPQPQMIQVTLDDTAEWSAQVRGRVVDVDGQPIRNAEVLASNPTSVGKSMTNSDGRFVITSLTADEHTVEVRCGQHVVYEGTHPSGDAEITIVMERAARLSGAVKAEDGSPITAFVVEVRPLGSLAEPWQHWHSMVDPAGEFSIGNLEPREYRVTAYAEGYTRPEAIKVELDERTAPVALTLGRAKGLFGRVVAHDGKPIGDAVVAPDEIAPQRAGMFGAPGFVRTGEDGGWSLSSVTARQIKVTAEGFRTRFAATPELVAGEMTGPLIVELTPMTGAGSQEPEYADGAGIGIRNAMRADGIEFTRVYPGTPAAEAGLVAGDVVIMIDGWRVADDPRSARIRGKAGTKIKLRVRRVDGTEIDVELVRRPFTREQLR